MQPRREPMANFRVATPRSGFFHSAPPPMSRGFMDHVPRQMKGEEEEARPSQNLWVGNVSADSTESMLMEIFGKFGDIDSITPYPYRNYAFVYFKNIEHAIAAKEGLQGVALGGSNLKIEFSRAAKPSKHLWVGGISQTVTKEQLEAEFLKFGRVEDFKFLRDRNSALVDYSNLEDAVSAVKFLNGRLLGGDPLRVDYLRSQPVKRESMANPHLQTVEVRDGRTNDQRTFMGTVDLGRRNFDIMICQPEPPQSILSKVQTAHGYDGGRNQSGPSNILWIGFPPSIKIDEQRLHNAVILFGEIERIKSFPSRHYAFVEFRSVDEARHAKDGLQGRLFNDPRIQILYSNSEFVPVDDAKDSAMLMTPLRGMLLPDALYRTGSQFGSIERLGPVGGPIDPNNVPGINIHAHTVGPRGFPEQHTPESRTPLSRPESFNNFSDTNINSPRSSGGWSRPPSLIAMGSRPLGLPPGAWDGYDANVSQRESKRPRVNEAYPVAALSDFRKLDNEVAGTLSGYYGAQPERSISNYNNASNTNEIMVSRENRGSLVNGNNQVVAGPGHMQPPSALASVPNSGGHREHYGVVDEDWSWQGTIAKGGTPVCCARCISIGRGIDAKFPEVVNCSARTDLDKLAEHFSQASDFGLVYFLPAGGHDIHTYQEFVHYLGSKHRAGVAKFSDGTTLFLVPPSDFSENYLKVPATDRLFGVVLKFHQQPGNAMYHNPSNRLTHDPSQQHIQRQHFPISQVDHATMALKEDHAEFNTGIPRSFSPPKTSHLGQTATPQSTNEISGLQPTVSLTPELIATINSLMPNSFQASGSLVQGSSMTQGTYDFTGSNDALTTNWHVSSPRSSEMWWQRQQPSTLPSHQLIPEQGTYQHQPQHNNPLPFSPDAIVSVPSSNNTIEQSGQGAVVNPSFQDPSIKGHQSSMMYQTTNNELAQPLDTGNRMDAHSGQVTMSCGQDQYQQEAPHNSQKSYAQMLTNGASENIQSLVPPQEKSMSSRSSDQYQAGGGSQVLPNVQVGHNGMSSELSSQVQQLQGIGAALLGHNQESSESEAEKNLRYQSTLQFAANLLQQLQQKQTANKSVTGGAQHRQ